MLVNGMPSPSPLKSPRSVVGGYPMMPELVFTPVVIAVIVPALSGVMWSADEVRDRAV